MKHFIGNLWQKRPVVVVLVIAGVTFILGLAFGGGSTAPGHVQTARTTAPNTIWTCSMHPNVRQPGPGQCPICGMDLIPATTGSGDDGDETPVITLSAAARKLAEIRVAPVERRHVTAELRLAGKIEYDETTLREIAAWVPGRLERLYVAYTGEYVATGAPLVELYSPELLVGQQELLAALNMINNLSAGAAENVRQTAQRTAAAAREKLRRWGLTPEQIQEIISRGTPVDRVTITAPQGGVVVRKDAVEGAYVMTGMPIYAIADLSTLWVQLDAYEEDLAWVRAGDEVEFTTEAIPGEVFTGTVAFIAPILDESTRAVRVRVEAPNPRGRLKPGMFVRSVLQAGIPGGIPDKPPLIIPATAPLITGTRAIVYVAVDGEEGTYEGREVTLGPRVGDSYVVRAGLEAGELVVVNGNFKIDSAIQLQARKSMMNPGAEKPLAVTEGDNKISETLNVPEPFARQIAALFTSYMAVQYALSHDTLAAALSAASEFVRMLDNVDMALLQGKAHSAWMGQVQLLKESADAIATSENLSAARVAFEPLSASLSAVVSMFGMGIDDSVYQVHCPMAFNNRGADWLQTKTAVENPYFGAKMFKCGTVKDTLLPKMSGN
jgi:Cu(I)/Ag(I) efflux system membrane fusion protein